MKQSGNTRKPVARVAPIAAALAIALAATACGESSSLSPTPAAQRPRPEHLPGVTIPVSLPSLTSEERQLPARNTCDGADVPFPIRWSKIPSGTAQLAVFVFNFKPVKGRFFFDWAVAGLSPTLNGLSGGALPAGAVVARNNFGHVGYSICPARGTHEIYVVKVVALRRPLTVKPGVDARALNQEVERTPKTVGLVGATYTRQ